MPSPSPSPAGTPDQSPDQPSSPLALTDAQITCIMALARPLPPDQRTAFVELLGAKLNGRREIGDGTLYQLCRDLQRELLIPPLETEPGHRSVSKYARR
jgi:hypothetical protein